MRILHFAAASFIATCATALPAYAQATLELTTEFTTVEQLSGGTRSHMDVGGAWDGSADLSGTDADRFRLTIENTSSTETAFDLQVELDLPAGFTHVPGAQTAPAGTLVTGTTGTLTIELPANTDLAPGGTLTLEVGALADAGTTSGIYGADYTVSYGSADGLSDQSAGPTPTVFVVAEGASILLANPPNQTAALGASVAFNLIVENTGIGGLFDVIIDESAIGAGLSLSAMTQTSPASPGATGSAPVLTLPYLAPGETFEVTADALVLACESLTNVIGATDRVANLLNEPALETTAQIELDLTVPMVALSVGNASLNYSGATTVTIGVQNTGMGPAESLELDTNINGLNVDVLSGTVSPGWSYSGNGRFTLTGGTLGASATTTLTFDVQPTDVCSAPGGGTVVATAEYANECGAPYAVPTELFTISPPSDAPTLSLGFSISDDRIEVGDTGFYTITANASNVTELAGGNLAVTHTIPATLSSSSTSVSAGSLDCSSCTPGTALTWTLTPTEAAAGAILTVNFTAPTDECEGGSVIQFSAATNTTTTAACPISANASGDLLIINSPDVVSSLNFNVANAPQSSWETGASTADGVRDAGEGEFIRFNAEYDFGSGQTGMWSTSSYADDFAGLNGQSLVPGSLLYNLNSSGFTPVPPAAITISSGSLLIDLAFVGAQLGNDVLGGSAINLELQYDTTVADSDLGGASQATVLQRSTLTIGAGAGSGSCNGVYKQGAYVPLARADVDVSISLPSGIDLCETFPATLQASLTTPHGADNLVLNLEDDDAYAYVAGQNPTFGGAFNSGNISIVETPGSQVAFTYTGGELNSTGTIQFQVSRKANTGTSGSPLSASAVFDSEESANTGLAGYSASGQDSPSFVFEGDLSSNVLAETYTVFEERVSFQFVILNGGSGGLYEVHALSTLPAGILVDVSATNAANPGFPLTANADPTIAEWDIATIAGGDSLFLTVEATVTADAACSGSALTNDLSVTWGCGGTVQQTAQDSQPTFEFSSGALSILHDTTATVAKLCNEGTIEIVVRNKGIASLQDVIVEEILDPSNSGLAIVPNSVQISIDGGAFSPTGDSSKNPVGSGTASSPYTWSSTQIPELTELDSQSLGDGDPTEVRIRFGITGDEALFGQEPTITARGSATLPCGDTLDSDSPGFPIPVEAPDLEVLTTGQNATTSSAFGAEVIASSGDSLRWRIRIENNGDETAEFVRLRIDLPGSGSPTGTLSPADSSGNTAVSDGDVLPLPELPAGAFYVYEIDQVFTGDCVTEDFSATVTFGCEDNGSNTPSNLSSSSAPSTALAQFNPDFSGNGIRFNTTHLSDGRAEITATITNSGADASGLQLTANLPGIAILDDSFTPVLESGSPVSLTSAPPYNSTNPAFTFSGTFADGDSLVLRYRVLPNSGFDLASDPFTQEETPANGFDPAIPAAGGLNHVLDFQNSCGESLQASRSQDLNLRTPDLDLAAGIDPQVVVPGQAVTLAFSLIGRGDSNSSVSRPELDFVLGTGWSNPTFAIDGGQPTAQTSFDFTDLGSISEGDSIEVVFSATATAGGPLSIQASSRALLHDDAGDAKLSVLSQDVIRPRLIGFELTKTLDTSVGDGTSLDATDGTDLAIGEQVTWRIVASWSGGTPGEDLSSGLLKQTLPADFEYLSHAVAAGSLSTSSVTTPTTGSPILQFNLVDFDQGGTFEYTVTGRLEDGVSINGGDIFVSNLGTGFDFLGSAFASSSSVDGLGGSLASLHAEQSVTAVLPILNLASEVANVSGGVAGNFSEAVESSAGDIVEFQITVDNTGDGPAFDLSLDDVLQSTSLELVALSGAGSDGIDNDGDGSIDEPAEGAFIAGPAGSTQFDDGNTGLTAGVPSATFARLDNGESLTVRFRAVVGSNAIPDATYTDLASLAASSLPGSPDEAEDFSPNDDSSDVTIQSLSLTKVLASTSESSTTGNALAVGEQALLRLELVLPAGQVPDLEVTDSLPQGLQLIGVQSVTLGSQVSGALISTTPSSLPAEGSGSDLAITWDFGTLQVGPSTDPAERRVTIEYQVQASNAAGVQNGGTFVDVSNYDFTGASGSQADQPIALNIVESQVGVTQTLDPTSGFDAGDELTLAVQLTNAGPAGAFDVDLVQTLPDGLAYKSGTALLDGVSIPDPDNSGTTLTLGRSQSSPFKLDLPQGGSARELMFTLVVQDSVIPEETLSPTATLDATSLDGDPPANLGVAHGTAGAQNGERTGSSTGANDLAANDATAAATVVNSAGLTTTVGSGVLTGGAFRVGDLVTYTIAFSAHEGTFPNFGLDVELPVGLAYVDLISVTSDGGFSTTQSDSPLAGDTGSLSFDYGTLTNSGDSGGEPFLVVFTARVLDSLTTLPLFDPQSLSLSSNADYDTASGTDEVQAPDVLIDVLQAELAFSFGLASGQSTSVGASESVDYRLFVDSIGDAPAYTTNLSLTLPEGLREETPATLSALLNGAPLALTTPTYDAGAGLLTYALEESQPLDATDELEVIVRATTDATVGGPLDLVADAQITSYQSKPASDLPENRLYPASAIAQALVSTAGPTDILKEVDLSVANIGDTVTWTITAPQTPVDSALHDLSILDAVPAQLRVVNLATNGTALGATVSGDSAPFSNSVAVDFDLVPAGAQAILTITAVLENQPSTDTTTTFTNSASFTWSTESGGTAQGPIDSNDVETSVTEPDLSVDLQPGSTDLADPNAGPQAGDAITYHIVIENSGDGSAYDMDLQALISEELINPVVSPAPDSPGSPSLAGNMSGDDAWSWTLPGPLDPGETFEFDLSLTLGGSVMPFDVLEAFAELEWTSVAGASSDERTGAGGVDDYESNDSDSPVLLTIGPLSLTKTDTGDGTYTIGDQVTWELNLQTVQGELSNLAFEDLLPAGMEFVSATLTPINLMAAGGGLVTLSAQPSPGDQGVLRFEVGDLESTGADPQLTLTLAALVQNTSANVNGLQLVNNALVEIESPPGSGSTFQVPATSSSTIELVEPALVIALDSPSNSVLGQVFQPLVRLNNPSGATAWQPTLALSYPEGTRTNDPVGLPNQLTITGGREITLSEGVDYVLSWTESSGTLEVRLTGGEGYLDPSETLVALLGAELDDDAVDGTGLEFSASATEYSSQDDSGGAPPVERVYLFALGAGTTGTPDGDPGDDGTDTAEITTNAPVISVTKAVDVQLVTPGDEVLYTLAILNDGSVDAEGLEILDDLPPGFEPDTLEIVSVTPASGTAVVDGFGGVHGTGRFELTGGTVASGSSLEVVLRAQLESVLPSGTILDNQAVAVVPGFSGSFLSDSTESSDDDAVETGNDPADPADDDATLATVESAPQIQLQKSAMDVNGAPLAVGDVIRYTITATNSGSENAVGLTLFDPIPSFTTYVEGSTTLNGAALSDVSGDSPLLAGAEVQDSNAGSGQLPVGGSWTVSFEVIVQDGDDGTVISNQATLQGAGEGSGAFSPILSNDPSTGLEGDATVLVVGSAPVLNVVKIAQDGNGGQLLPGDALLYRILIENVGGGAANGLTFVDPIPTGTSYNGGLLFFDPDADGPLDPIVLTDAADGDPGDVNVTQPGAVTVQLTELVGGASFEIGFVVEVDPGAALGQQIFNQATVGAIGLAEELSDADGNDTNGDQPTVSVVGSAPALLLTKSVDDLNGGLVQAGDRLRYQLALRNVGTDVATGVTLFDATPPAGTNYVDGSTNRDGVALPDVAGNSPLAGGLSLQDLPVGATTVVAFEVDVDSSVGFGQVISNQASYTADGGLSGLSDSDVDDGSEAGNDPDNPGDDDATVLQIGAAPGSANLSGFVWLDVDHDDVFDLGEAPQAGWTIEILRDDLFLVATESLSDGSFAFAGLPPGSGYSVRFKAPGNDVVYGGAVSSEPGVDLTAGQIDNLTLQSGANVLAQNLPIDPSGVVYDSVARTPVPGATLTVSGPPGFDASTMLPPGQQGQVTTSDGFYRFDLINGAPAGTYSIAFDVPPGYLPSFPSILIEPTAGPLDPTGAGNHLLVQPQPGAPQLGEDTTYYIAFSLAPGDPDVLNNHVPIDPVLEGAIALSKTSPRKTVERGGFVPYTIRATNTLSADLTPTDLVDVLPPGFKYVEGSAQIDGVPATPQVAGRQLTFAGLTVPANGTVELDLIAIVGAGVGDGEFINQAYARNPIADATISNLATASVLVVPDPLFDHTDILGKVFDDRNGNGVQDPGELGIPDVRLATARGLVVTTDVHGRFHVVCPEIPNLRTGSNFILKIDERSLPTGFRTTTENPRVVRITRGKFARIDFGASVGRVLAVTADAAAFQPDLATLQADAHAELSQGLVSLAEGSANEAPLTVRLGYYATSGEDPELARTRLESLEQQVRDLWSAADGAGPLRVERDGVLQEVQGHSPRSATAEESGIESSVDSRPELVEEFTVAESESPSSATSISREQAPGKVTAAPLVRAQESPIQTEVPRQFELPRAPRGLALSLDGQGLDGSPGTEPSDTDRRVDLELANLDLQVRADDLWVEPALSISAWPQAWSPGRSVEFRSYSNYAAFIESAELRLFPAGDSPAGIPLETLQLTPGDGLSWTPSQELLDKYRGELHFTLRVYDSQGRYDETGRQSLNFLEHDAPWPSDEEVAQQLLSRWGQNGLQFRNIPVEGVAITVSGRNVPEGTHPCVQGQSVPVSDDGRFATRVLLPDGSNAVSIEVFDARGRGLSLERKVIAPLDDWFFVGLAELTIGENNSAGPAELFAGDDSFLPTGEDGPFQDELYVNGRVAFYLKGKVLGGALLTAALDTGDEPLDEILSRLDEKDPRAFLRRLDPTVYYPVYGDDSTVIEDAPTRGRFYVRLERGNDRVLWGDFNVRMTQTELAQVDRALYGAHLRWLSDDMAPTGESRSEVELFAAEPGTLSGRDDLRGTGGSLYFTSRQDLTVGSERVRIEVRDKVSGLVLSTEDLVPNQDYTVDYIQGRIFLNTALPSFVVDGDLVQTGPNAGHPTFLVVRYEHTPGFDQLEDLAVGGRASTWLTDNVKIGATVSEQEQQGQDGRLLGVDVTLRQSDNTYLRAEAAATEGAGNGSTNSLDGGFFFDPQSGFATDDDRASAFHLEGAVDLSEVTEGDLSGQLTAYGTVREQGFDAPGQSALEDTTLLGARYTGQLSEDTSLRAQFDSRDESSRGSQRAAEVDVVHRVDESWSAKLGLRFDDLDQGTLTSFTQADGARIDAALHLTYAAGQDWSAGVFGQATLDRDDGRLANNRYGLEARRRFSDRFAMESAISGGNGGVGGRLTGEFRIDDRTETYLSYLSNVDRSDTGLSGNNGAFVAGAKHRFSDAWSVYGEERIGTGSQSNLVHAYGLDFTPDDRWSFGFAGETGSIENPEQGALDRMALSLTGGYSSDDVKFASAIEFRSDESLNGTRETWLLRTQASTQVDPDWRALSRFQTALSNESTGAFFDGEFTEIVLGMAYRPVEHNRLNALLKYTYLEDVPTEGQTSIGGAAPIAQRSHVLSADATYDLWDRVSVGGKLAGRLGELRTEDSEWFDSLAWLALLRVDFHVVHEWDWMIEGRRLEVTEAEDVLWGAQTAIYRHMGENLKFGVGYNFADFSDDLTDMDYDSQGWFINLVGKF